MAMYDKHYPFTNVVDMMLSNPMGRPESKPLSIDAATGEAITLNHLRHLVGAFHAGLRRFGLKKGDTVCFYSPNNVCIDNNNNNNKYKHIRKNNFLQQSHYAA